MKYIYLLFLCFLLINQGTAQSLDWIWAQSGSSPSPEFSEGISTDANGNVFVIGRFDGDSISFGSFTLYNQGSGNLDSYIVKYDLVGNPVWAKSIGGINMEYVRDIQTDAQGNFYVTGFFMSDTLAVDSTILINTGGADIFIMKFDTGGNLIWANSAGGTGSEEGTKLILDPSGNPVITGYFNGIMTIDTTTLISQSVADVFILKYDSTGIFQWGLSAGGDDMDYGEAITIDSDYNIILGGRFSSSSITFGTSTLINPAPVTTSCIFVAKFDSAGNFQWARAEGGNGYDHVLGLATDLAGNIIMTGPFEDPMLFIGSNFLTNNGAADTYIVKYSPAGNVIWAHSFGGVSNDMANAIECSADGNFIIAGWFTSSSISFGTTVITNAGGSDIFLAAYDSLGTMQWIKTIGDFGMEDCGGIAMGANDDVYVTGWSGGPALQLGSLSLLNAGGNDVFTAKLGDVTGVEEQIDKIRFLVYPNPTQGIVAIDSKEIVDEVEVWNTSGQLIYEDDPGLKTVNLRIDKAGLYFIRVLSGNKTSIGKIVVSD